MEKRKLFIVIAVILIFLVIILLLFKSCNPREKTIDSPEEEYSAFINANTEFTCEILKNPTLVNDQEASEEKLRAAYEKYFFPVDDDESMLEILAKYENNLEVAGIIQTNSTPCAEGGNPIFYQTAEIK